MEPSYRDQSKLHLKALIYANALNLSVIVAEIVTGIISHSLALLANAGHDFADSLAVGVSMVAAYLITKKPTDKKSFGYLRTSILATVFNAGVIGITAVLILILAIYRFISPTSVRPGFLIVMGIISAITNLVAAFISKAPSTIKGENFRTKSKKRNLLRQSTAVHFLIDSLGSLLVVVAGIGIDFYSRLTFLDPAAALLISIGAILTTYQLLSQSANILLEATPRDIKVDSVIETMQTFDSVVGVHDVHIWSISSDYYAMSAHIMLEDNCSLEVVQNLISKIKDKLFENYKIDHLTLEPESNRCELQEQNCL